MSDLIGSPTFPTPLSGSSGRIRVMLENPSGGQLRPAVFPAANIEYITSADKNDQESVIRFLGGAEVIVYLPLDALEELIYARDVRAGPVIDLTAETTPPIRPAYRDRSLSLMDDDTPRRRIVRPFSESARDADPTPPDLARFMERMVKAPPREGLLIWAEGFPINADNEHEEPRPYEFALQDVDSVDDCALFPDERTFVSLKDKKSFYLNVPVSVYRQMTEEAQVSGRKFLVISKQGRASANQNEPTDDAYSADGFRPLRRGSSFFGG